MAQLGFLKYYAEEFLNQSEDKAGSRARDELRNQLSMLGHPEPIPHWHFQVKCKVQQELYIARELLCIIWLFFHPSVEIVISTVQLPILEAQPYEVLSILDSQPKVEVFACASKYFIFPANVAKA